MKIKYTTINAEYVVFRVVKIISYTISVKVKFSPFIIGWEWEWVDYKMLNMSRIYVDSIVLSVTKKIDKSPDLVEVKYLPTLASQKGKEGRGK